MHKALRSFVTLLAAAALFAAPCAPAVASNPACHMQGCDDGPLERISSSTCCCASNAPAEAGGPAPSASCSAKVSTAPIGPDQYTLEADLVAPPAFEKTSDPEPLYILHASLLM